MAAVASRESSLGTDFWLFISILGGIFCLGCTPKQYKQQADDQVYRIIDKKWQEDFGNRSNYRISDVPPGANDIQTEQAVPSSGKTHPRTLLGLCEKGSC